MVNPLTVQEYERLGIKEQYIETAHDEALSIKREVTKSDPKPRIQVTDCYRIQIQDDQGVTSEYIIWQQDIIAKSAIDNTHRWHELADDTCIYYTPLVEKAIRLNPETEQQETYVNQVLGMDTHYQYPFNKQNIDMIKKKVNIRTRFYVKDESDFVRAVPDFATWSTKSFADLIGASMGSGPGFGSQGAV